MPSMLDLAAQVKRLTASQTARIASSRLWDGMMVLARGQSCPSGMVSGSCGLASVQGQPVWLVGGEVTGFFSVFICVHRCPFQFRHESANKL